MDKLLVVLGGIGFFVLVSLVFCLPVYWLWNGCLVGAIDGVKEVTWLQAWGLNILAGFMFKETSVSFKK